MLTDMNILEAMIHRILIYVLQTKFHVVQKENKLPEGFPRKRSDSCPSNQYRSPFAAKHCLRDILVDIKQYCAIQTKWC